MEHTGWSTETIAWLLAARGPDLVPIVRVPSIEANAIGRVLDVGALVRHLARNPSPDCSFER